MSFIPFSMYFGRLHKFLEFLNPKRNSRKRKNTGTGIGRFWPEAYLQGTDHGHIAAHGPRA
jgi:hypothetical protein